MISYDIEVVKSVQYPVTPHYSSYRASYPNIESQKDLDNWIENTEFKIGSYVTFVSGGLTQFNLPHSVYIIKDYHRDFETLLISNYAPFSPKVVLLQRLPRIDWSDDTIKPDVVENLRLLWPNEIPLVEEHLDRVRNHRPAQT